MLPPDTPCAVALEFWIAKVMPSAAPAPPWSVNRKSKSLENPARTFTLAAVHALPDCPFRAGVRRRTLPTAAALPPRLSPDVEEKSGKLMQVGGGLPPVHVFVALAVSAPSVATMASSPAFAPA